MAETLKIQIELSGGGGENNASDAAGIKSDTAKENAKAFFTLDRAKAVAKQFATQIVDRHVATIGSRTGNYVVQERVQRGLGIASKVIGIGVSFKINPILGALNVVSEGVGLAFDIAERNREIMWQNRAASELARRAGYLANQNRGV